MTVVSSEKGAVLATSAAPPDGAFVTVPAELVGDRAVVGLADGTAQVVPLK